MLMGANPSLIKLGDNYPVESVSWFDAVKFCNALDDAMGLDKCNNERTWECNFSKNGFRLPTEAEWEYACRAGTETYFYTGNAISSNGTTSTDLDKAGWYSGNSGSTTHPVDVGSYPDNPYGLYDMCGNVWEWCSDWYGAYMSDSQTNPIGLDSGSGRVGRGGCWYNNAGNCRSASRSGRNPTYVDDAMGFRVVRRP